MCAWIDYKSILVLMLHLYFLLILPVIKLTATSEYRYFTLYLFYIYMHRYICINKYEIVLDISYVYWLLPTCSVEIFYKLITFIFHVEETRALYILSQWPVSGLHPSLEIHSYTDLHRQYIASENQREWKSCIAENTSQIYLTCISQRC